MMLPNYTNQKCNH